MDLLHTEPAAIWRMLIPRRQWLFADDLPESELIFTYRDKVYFVNQDGSVISIQKPRHLEHMDAGALYDFLALTSEAFDFDDNGMFDYGSLLKEMGYMVPTVRTSEQGTYLIEIVNLLNPEQMVSRYELKKVDATFALYHAVLRCHELNKKGDGQFEHEVKRIAKVEKFVAKNLHEKLQF